MTNTLLGKSSLSLTELCVGALGGATCWLLHLGGSYLLLTIGCNEGWPGIRTMLITLTAVLAIAALATGVFAYRRVQRLGVHPDWSLALNVPMNRELFLMIVGTVSSAVFLLIILAQGLPPLFVPLCTEV